jgi:hypothetical protein
MRIGLVISLIMWIGIYVGAMALIREHKQTEWHGYQAPIHNLKGQFNI